MGILGGIGEAFADRNFRIYSIGSMTSWTTYFVQTIAFAWATWDTTRSTTWLAAIGLLGTGSMILLLPLGGVLADRVDRFRMLLAAYAFDALKAVVLTVLAVTDHLTLPVLCMSALCHGVIHSFSIPASYGLMPRFVSPERLSSAIAVAAAYSQFALFAGPAFAGWILVHGGVSAAFAVNVAGYAVFFLTAMFLRTPTGYRQPEGAQKSIRQDMLDGFRHVIVHRGLSAVLLIVLVGDGTMMAVNQMMPAYSEHVLGMGAGGLSILLGAAGVGATLAALWLAHGGARRATFGIVLLAVLGVAFATAGLALAPSIAVAGAAMLLFGFSGETRRTATVSLMQATVDDSRRGRVMSSLFLFTQIAGGIGTLLVGVTAAETGLRLPFAVAAALLGLLWLVMTRRCATLSASFGA